MSLKVYDYMLHDFRYFDPNNNIHSIKKCGLAARCDVDVADRGTIIVSISGRDVEIPVVEVTTGNVKLVDQEGFECDFPKQEDGVAYITSTMVAQCLRRPDVFAPDTTKYGVVRGNRGGVLAVKHLQSFH